MLDQAHPRRVPLRWSRVLLLEVAYHIIFQNFTRFFQVLLIPASLFRHADQAAVLRKAVGHWPVPALRPAGDGTFCGDLKDVSQSLEPGVRLHPVIEFFTLVPVVVPVHPTLNPKLIGRGQPAGELHIHRPFRLQTGDVLQQEQRKSGLPGNVQESAGCEVVQPCLGIFPLLPGVERQELLDGLAVLEGVWTLVRLICKDPSPIIFPSVIAKLIIRILFLRARFLLLHRVRKIVLGIVQRRLIRLAKLHKALRVLLRVAGAGFLGVGPLDSGDLLGRLQP